MKAQTRDYLDKANDNIKAGLDLIRLSLNSGCNCSPLVL